MIIGQQEKMDVFLNVLNDTIEADTTDLKMKLQS